MPLLYIFSLQSSNIIYLSMTALWAEQLPSLQHLAVPLTAIFLAVYPSTSTSVSNCSVPAGNSVCGPEGGLVWTHRHTHTHTHTHRVGWIIEVRVPSIYSWGSPHPYRTRLFQEGWFGEERPQSCRPHPSPITLYIVQYTPWFSRVNVVVIGTVGEGVDISYSPPEKNWSNTVI